MFSFCFGLQHGSVPSFSIAIKTHTRMHMYSVHTYSNIAYMYVYVYVYDKKRFLLNAVVFTRNEFTTSSSLECASACDALWFYLHIAF